MPRDLDRCLGDDEPFGLIGFLADAVGEPHE
jgi:hypothetical protein